MQQQKKLMAKEFNYILHNIFEWIEAYKWNC